MVYIHYGSKRITSTVVNNQIESVNYTLKKLGKRRYFDYEGVGTPMKWTIWEVTNQKKQKLLSNANNRDVYLYFLGMGLILSL